LISVDGFNRAFYQDPGYHTPQLRRMASEGASAERVIPVFPSLTYPGHAALVTGCLPVRSGVPTNVIEGSAEWYWESKHLKSKPIWRAAEENGMRVALMGWPTTVGAEVTHNIPEVFYVPNTGPLSTAERIALHSTKGTMELLGVEVPQDFPTWDQYMTQACEKLLKEERADLILVHLIQVDKAQHLHGPEAPEVAEAASRVDALIGRIREAAGPEALVAVVGDHGFRPYREILYPKKMLLEGGLSGEASVHAAGGSAAVYGGGPRVKEFFQTRSLGRYRMVEREELDRLGAFPGADFALAALTDAVFSYESDGPRFIEGVRGQHGHLPETVPTGWIMTGPGIRPGSNLGVCRIVDVAPTLAKRMGFSLPEADGRVRGDSTWFSSPSPLSVYQTAASFLR
jgi:predicted AlkP superfamily pyrophosphatase or phosphodiesterase